MENFSNAERAEVLTQALPYIKRYVGKVVVVKYGGNAMINESLKKQVMEDIVLLWLIGVKVVLVHGGGPEINDLMNKLGKKAEFVALACIFSVILHKVHLQGVSLAAFTLYNLTKNLTAQTNDNLCAVLP